MRRNTILAVGLVILSTTGWAQKLSTYIEPITGATYIQFSAEGFPPSCYEQRSKNPDFYISVPLHHYSPTGIDNPVLAPDGTPLTVLRVRKMAQKQSGLAALAAKVSHRFILSPTDVMIDGSTIVIALNKNNLMDWATANGYLATANSVTYDVPSSAVAMGCPMYRGKNGTDPIGSWRVPNHMEFALISLFYSKVVLMDRTQTGFQDLVSGGLTNYCCSDLRPNSNTQSMCFRVNENPFVMSSSGRTKTDVQYLRCIRDID